MAANKTDVFDTDARITPDFHYHVVAGVKGGESPDYLNICLTRQSAIDDLASVYGLTGHERAALRNSGYLDLSHRWEEYCQIITCNGGCLTAEHGLIHLSDNETTLDYALAGCDICRKLAAEEE